MTFNRTVLPSYYGLLRLCCEHSRTFTRQLSTHSNMKWAFENLTPRMNQYPQVGPTSKKMLTEHTGYGAVSCVLCVCCYALLFVFFLLFSFSFFCLFVSGSAWLQMCLCLGLCLYLCAFTYRCKCPVGIHEVVADSRVCSSLRLWTSCFLSCICLRGVLQLI